MAQLITTTNIEEFHPLFHGKKPLWRIYEDLYKKLEHLFGGTELIHFFAQPKFSGSDNVSWMTSLEGNIYPFSKVDDVAINHLELLQAQANELYIHILEKEKNQEKRKEYFDFLDKCLSIADENDIYFLQNQEGKKQFILVMWGNSQTKEKNILASQVEVKKISPRIKITQKGKILDNAKFEITINKETLEYVTDENGIIQLPVTELLSTIYIVQKDARGNIVYTKEIIVDKEDISLDVHKAKIDSHTIIIKAIDRNNRPLSNLKLKLLYLNSEIERTTDEEGIIVLEHISLNTEITVIQEVTAKKIIKKKFLFNDKSKKEFIFKGYNFTDNYLTIKVEYADGQPFADAEMQIKIGEKTVVKKANNEGLIVVEEVPLNSEIVCRQIVDGIPQFQRKYIYDEERKEVVFKSFLKKKELKTIKIKVSDANGNPIKFLSVKLINGHEWKFAVTDAEGVAKFEKIDCTKSTRIEIKHKNKIIEDELLCTDKDEFSFVFGKKIQSKSLFYIIGGVAAILAILLIVMFMASSNKDKNIDQASATEQTDTNTNVVAKPQKQEATIEVQDYYYGKPVVARITIESDSGKTEIITDSLGKALIEFYPKLKYRITAIADNYDTLTVKSANLQKETVLLLKPSDIFVRKDTVLCNSYAYAEGKPKVLQIVKLNKSTDVLKMRFYKRYVSDIVKIYTGGYGNLNDKNLIYNNRIYKDTAFLYINLPQKDSLFTIEITAGEKTTPNWIFKVYCP